VFEGGSLDINGNADISGNLTGVDILTCGGINENIGNVNLRNYFLSTGDAGGSFLIGKIEHGDDVDGAISATCHFSYDYGTSTNNNTLHFNFSQRDGTARGTWWYEGDDQDGANDRVHARLIDDGSGVMFDDGSTHVTQTNIPPDPSSISLACTLSLAPS
jgi:hypothetical protein